MKRKIILWILLIVVVAVVGSSYAYYRRASAAPQATSEAALQTATVRRGNLVISATGSGSVIPNSELSVGFEMSGKITELLVEVGDKVKAGDVLAKLKSNESEATLAAQLSAAELAVLQAQQNLAEAQEPADALSLAQAEADLAAAQEALDELLHPSESAIAQAELAVIEAQDAVDEAQATVDKLSYGRASQATLEAARAAYLLAQDKVDRLQEMYESTPGDPTEDAMKAQALSNLAAAKVERDRALANLNWYLGKPSAAEIAEKNAALAEAKGQLAAAQEQLEALQNPPAVEVALAKAKIADLEAKLAELKAKPDPNEVKMAEAELANAEANLAIKQAAMQTQELLSPMDGTVMEINAAVGDIVSTSPIITIANLDLPMLQVYLDESDLNSVGVGFAIEVTFDALPNQTFSGKIIRVDPSLTSMQNVAAVRALAQLDAESFTKPQTLPVGLNATVEVINSKAEGVLLVPVEALRELAAGKYGVFVMENGEPVLKVVEVGIMDYTYAEIKSGLNEGDVVTTGIVETGE